MRRVIGVVFATTVIALTVGWNYSAANTDRAAEIPRTGEAKYSITCPNGVKVGIKGAQAGWYAGPDQSHSFIEATVVRQGNASFITCDYGTAGIKKYALSQMATPGYDCRLIAVGSREVVCSQKPKAPIKIK